MVSERDCARRSSHYRSLWDLLDPKLASVRALPLVLWNKLSISSHLIFTVFEFPDELILSVLSHISPNFGQYARLHFQWHITDSVYCYRQQRAFLLSLGMTCRAMCLRLLPWIWERVELHSGNWVRRPNAIVGALHADPYLGMSVKYFHPSICPWVGADLYPLKVSDDISPTG